MAPKTLMAWILVMAKETDDQELLLVTINRTVLFQRVVKCFDDWLKRLRVGSTNYVNTLCDQPKCQQVS